MWASRTHTTGAARGGHTLIEVLISTAIMSIVLAALVSAMLLAGKAVPDAGDPAAAAVAAAGVAAHIAGELQLGLTFIDRSPTAVKFTVADRDGDSNPETIRYFWDGTPGGDLEIKYNGGLDAVVLDDVEEFELLYDTEVVTVQKPTVVESSEVELASYPSAAGLATETVTSANWIGQYFQPALPPTAVTWKVTRVLFRAKTSGAVAGVTRVQLRPPGGNNGPSPVVLEEVLMNETDLGAFYAWTQFDYSTLDDLNPAQPLFLVLEWQAGAAAADVETDDGAGSGLVRSSNGGASWSPVGRSMLFYVYGTYTEPGPPVPVNHTYLTGVRIKLRTGSDTTARIQTGALILDPPEINP